MYWHEIHLFLYTQKQPQQKSTYKHRLYCSMFYFFLYSWKSSGLVLSVQSSDITTDTRNFQCGSIPTHFNGSRASVFLFFFYSVTFLLYLGIFFFLRNLCPILTSNNKVNQIAVVRHGNFVPIWVEIKIKKIIKIKGKRKKKRGRVDIEGKSKERIIKKKERWEG